MNYCSGNQNTSLSANIAGLILAKEMAELQRHSVPVSAKYNMAEQ
jgi:hypothetical protein